MESLPTKEHEYWVGLHINDGLSRRRGSLRIWMENAPHLHGWGGPPNSCEEAWGKCAHMGEDFREGQIQTATEISGEYQNLARETTPAALR